MSYEVTTMETESGPDLVVYVFLDGSLVNPLDVPNAALVAIEDAAREADSGTLICGGVTYDWMTRPCDYP